MIGIIRIVEWPNEAMIKIISLSRLIEGGAAILQQIMKNHHIDIIGIRLRIPFVRIKLRVWVDSYVILARQNSAEELNAWAIIIVIPPNIPIDEFDNIPTHIRPICPIDA